MGKKTLNEILSRSSSKMFVFPKVTRVIRNTSTERFIPSYIFTDIARNVSLDVRCVFFRNHFLTILFNTQYLFLSYKSCCK